MIFFPEPETVFADQIRLHRQYLLPLMSFDLSRINHTWSGPIHFVSPIEPYDGTLAEGTENAHNYYCRENWIAFDIIGDKYELKTDFKFFQKNAIETGSSRDFHWPYHKYPAERLHQDLIQHYQKVEETYQFRKLAYQSGILKNEKLLQDTKIGGFPEDANWAHCSKFPLKIIEDQVVNAEGERHSATLYYPLDENGNEFDYVGWIEPYSTTGGPCCSVHLFYSADQKIALFTFDWT